MSGNTAVTLSGFDMGNPTSTFAIKDLPIPQPGPGELRIKIVLRPCNPAGK